MKKIYQDRRSPRPLLRIPAPPGARKMSAAAKPSPYATAADGSAIDPAAFRASARADSAKIKELQARTIDIVVDTPSFSG